MQVEGQGERAPVACLRVEGGDVPAEHGGDAEGALEDALKHDPHGHEADLAVVGELFDVVPELTSKSP